MSVTMSTIAAETERRSSLQHRHVAPSESAAQCLTNSLDDSFTPVEPLNIVEASRIADSTVPEGGYGWVVIAGCAVLTWWYLGMSYSWGIMQSALVDRGLSSASSLSFIGFLCVTFNSILALAHARFIRVVGTRQAALIGISCLGGGTILSGFCTENVGGLFVTSGVLAGVGTRYVENLLGIMDVHANPSLLLQSLLYARLYHAIAILQQETWSGHRNNLCSWRPRRHCTDGRDERTHRESRTCVDLSIAWLHDPGNWCTGCLGHKRTSTYQEECFC